MPSPAIFFFVTSENKPKKQNIVNLKFKKEIGTK